ncbi:hypothetical protein IMCGPPIG_01866 [Stenotrophomonas maltophilia]|jgi:hypothetical protein|uniref:Uncharacterized protein n=1 Tax=Stenotrophomonas maltophilia TaxID=40324 RepID=A0A2J0U986_STEMA|nr:hypothetical protein [Stenotrophomonas maltophilia]KKF88280.1 hypothetical protein XY58_09625 [Stenotrophomonas maltophilia]MBA0255721.1 hypothetical protein [Stenotrophomonas maltophilia]MBA0452086.1 hypothetical protein [Stenotrophomonas maltophilia]MBA0480460.1 hypothetical protein [Stenotrophomonas maltophilia]MBA0489744.1 hypothetical protein [Stenotrophomonas maltophilia]
MNDESKGTDAGSASQTDADADRDTLFIRSPEDFTSDFLSGWIVDGRSGGLVRGRLHEEGHVSMIEHVGPLGTFEFRGVMEGGEYIMSTDATAAHFDRLVQINSDKTPCDIPLPDAPPGRVIDVAAEPHDKLLLIQRQFIINRVSTRRHLSELVALNASHTYYRGQFFSDDVVTYLNDHPELGDGPAVDGD